MYIGCMYISRNEREGVERLQVYVYRLYVYKQERKNIMANKPEKRKMAAPVLGNVHTVCSNEKISIATKIKLNQLAISLYICH